MTWPGFPPPADPEWIRYERSLAFNALIDETKARLVPIRETLARIQRATTDALAAFARYGAPLHALAHEMRELDRIAVEQEWRVD